MAGNIGCFTVGCNDPVVGQCSGYKDNCGQFYCHTHSAGKLCVECGERKAYEEKLEDYLATSRGIKAPWTSIRWAIVLIILGLLVGWGVGPLVPFFGGAQWVFFVGGICLLLSAFNKHNKARRTVEAIDQAKPGFAEFYRKWKKADNQQSREYLVGEILGTVGAGVAGAAKGAGESIKIVREEDRKFREGTPRDVENALRDVGRKLDKL